MLEVPLAASRRPRAGRSRRCVAGRVNDHAVRPDQGVSTVFACLSVCLLMAVTALGIRLGGAMLARQQAETAADLGALAGAAQILKGQGPACAAAVEVVTANRARLTSCRADGLDLLIEVQLPAPGWGGTAFAHARAGPVTTR